MTEPLDVHLVSSSAVAWGAETSLRLLVDQLRASGHRLHLLCPPGELPGFFDSHVDSTRVLPELTTPGGGMRARQDVGTRRLVAWSWEAARAVTRVLRDAPTGPVHVASANLWALTLRQRHGRRLVMDLHDPVDSRGLKALLRVGLRRSDHLLQVSAFVGDHVRSRAPRTTLPRPTDFRPTSTRPGGGPLRVLVAGRVDPEKRLHLVLDAVHGLPECQLLIAGVPSPGHEAYAQELVGRVATTRPGDGVEFLGRVSDMQGLLDTVDVLLCANPREPLGRTVLEAQASGLAVVVPDRGGAAELVADGVDGLRFRHDDPADLRRAVGLCRSEHLRRRLGDSAAAKAKQSYAPEAYARAVSDVYVGSRPARHRRR